MLFDTTLECDMFTPHFTVANICDSTIGPLRESIDTALDPGGSTADRPNDGARAVVTEALCFISNLCRLS